jgi:hypothetical protein
MPDLGTALTATSPVATCVIITRRERRSIELRSRKNIVLIGCITSPVHHLAFLGKLRFFGEIIVTMELSDIRCNLDAL